jgi:hypothetical protein
LPKLVSGGGNFQKEKKRAVKLMSAWPPRAYRLPESPAFPLERIALRLMPDMLSKLSFFPFSFGKIFWKGRKKRDLTDF